MEDYKKALSIAVLAAKIILESSGETYRAEDTALRLCWSFGLKDVDILAFPTGFTLCATLPGGTRETRIQRIKERSIHLKNINDVNTVSRLAAEKKLSVDEAYSKLETIVNSSKANPLSLLIAFAFASGFFSVMFGGRLLEFIISFVCGLIVQGLIPFYVKRNAPSILISLFSGLVASAIAIGACHFVPANSSTIIVGTIMPLLPGIAMTNAIRDTMRGDLLSGIGRGIEALLCVIAIAAGVSIVIFI